MKTESNIQEKFGRVVFELYEQKNKHSHHDIATQPQLHQS